ncbi:MAG: GldG family protein [Chromatiales bacterium]
MDDRFSRRWYRRLDSLVFYLLLLAAVGLAGWLSVRYQVQWDWTAGGRNSLSEASRRVMERLEAPLTITAFAPENPVLRQQITRLIDRYRRAAPELRFSFVDPQTEPQRVRELGIEIAGELLLEYGGRRERLDRLSEESLTNAIQRLALRGERWIAYLRGHGERDLEGRANHDLGDFGMELERKGFEIQPLDLAASPTVPDNTALLLVAGPQVALLPGEWALISDYLERGGNLLWLTDPDSPVDPARLRALLGVRALPGVVVDLNAAALGIREPGVALVTEYPRHPATAGLERLTLFPRASALEIDPPDGWEASALLPTLERTWNETGGLEGAPGIDPDLGERAGPLVIGYALERKADETAQRALVLGDGDFLSNAFLGNVGNLDLGLNLVRWVAGEDQLLDIPAKTARDLDLQLSRIALAVIGFGFLLVLPLGFAAAGATVWWRRRRR